MAYDVAVREVEAQPVAAIREHARLQGIAGTMADAFGELYGYLGKIGTRPDGPPLVVYFDVDERRGVEMEVCVPVPGKVEGEGRVTPDELPAGEVAVTMHRGPYGSITPAYRAVERWVHEQGRELAGPPRERYLNSPDQVGPEDLETEIEWPIR